MPRRAEQSTCFKRTWPGQRAARLHIAALMHVSGSVCYAKCRGERGVHNCLSLLSASPPCVPETHLMVSTRQPDWGQKCTWKCLYLWRSVQIQLHGSGGSMTVGTFLHSFFLADRTHPRDFTSGRNALKRFFFYDEGVSRHISISSSSTGDCWRRAVSLTGRIKGNFLFGWLHERARTRQQWRSALTNSFPESLPASLMPGSCTASAKPACCRGAPRYAEPGMTQGWKLPLSQQVRAADAALAQAAPKLPKVTWGRFAPLAQEEEMQRGITSPCPFRDAGTITNQLRISPLGSPAQVFGFSSRRRWQGLAGRRELWAGTDSEAVCTRAVF